MIRRFYVFRGVFFNISDENVFKLIFLFPTLTVYVDSFPTKPPPDGDVVVIERHMAGSISPTVFAAFVAWLKMYTWFLVTRKTGADD